MIDAAKACEMIAQRFSIKYIGGCSDVGTGYVIAFLGYNGEVLLGNPWLVDKQTGEITVYIVPEHFDDLKRAKRIPVPKPYRFKGKRPTLADLNIKNTKVK